MLAYLSMDRGPDFRWDAFVAGLTQCGYRVTQRPRHHPGDLVVVWNRHSGKDKEACAAEGSDGKVIVAENGYIGKGADGKPIYALARHHHNGAGVWPEGEDDRWASLGIELAPWRRDGEHILVLPQRGIGPAGVAMPKNWPNEIVKRLGRVTRRPIKVRPHPGLHKGSLKPDLKDCWAVVTWGSGAAIKAIAAGVPVFHELKPWIGAPAASFGIDRLEEPFLGDRLPMFRRLAHAQYSCAEIATGEPFRKLLAL